MQDVFRRAAAPLVHFKASSVQQQLISSGKWPPVQVTVSITVNVKGFEGGQAF
jgi:hypothetical protein